VGILGDGTAGFGACIKASTGSIWRWHVCSLCSRLRDALVYWGELAITPCVLPKL
jgi:hypothetical protein